METTKTKVVEFKDKARRDNSNSKNKVKQIEIYDQKIAVEKEVKFLGIWFDEHLNFKTQMKEIKNKGKRSLNLLKYTCGVYWGIETETAIMLYKSLVRSTIEYGIGIWFPREYKEKLKLKRIQYAGIRRAMGYRCSTPTNVMIAETKVTRMEDRALYTTINLLCKNLIYGNKELEKDLMIMEKMK